MTYLSKTYNRNVVNLVYDIFKAYNRNVVNLVYDIFKAYNRNVVNLVYDIFKAIPGPNFIIKDLPSVLILIITDNILNDLLCCSNKYNRRLCRIIGKLYILLLAFLMNLS